MPLYSAVGGARELCCCWAVSSAFLTVRLCLLEKTNAKLVKGLRLVVVESVDTFLDRI